MVRKTISTLVKRLTQDSGCKKVKVERYLRNVRVFLNPTDHPVDNGSFEGGP
jgi:hypothetical protein